MDKFFHPNVIRSFLLMNGVLAGLFVSSFSLAEAPKIIWIDPENHDDPCPAAIKWTPIEGNTSQSIVVTRPDTMKLVDNCQDTNLSVHNEIFFCNWSKEQNLKEGFIEINTIVNGKRVSDNRVCMIKKKE